MNSILSEERFTILEDLRFGRFSFNGQNPEIEVVSNLFLLNNLFLKKLMVYHECIRTGVEPPADEFEDGELISIEEEDEEAEIRNQEEMSEENEICRVFEGGLDREWAVKEKFRKYVKFYLRMFFIIILEIITHPAKK